MSGESRAFGAGGTVFFDGRTVPVRPRDNFFDGFIEAEVVKARGNPMDLVVAAAAGMKDSNGAVDEKTLVLLVSSVMQEAKTWRNCTDWEKRVFLATPFGEALTLWYCLKAGFDSNWTIDRVRYVMGESLRAAIKAGNQAIAEWNGWRNGLFEAIDKAGGEDLLGNLTGLRLIPKETEAQAQENSSEDSGKNKESSQNTAEG